MDEDRLTAVCDRLRTAGYSVERPGRPDAPPAVATPGEAATSLVSTRSLAVEPLHDAEPTTLFARLSNNLNHDRDALFVGDDGTASAALDVLRDPPLLRGQDDDRKTFYLGPDRLAAAGGGYLCWRADDPRFAWHEEAASDPIRGQSRRGSRFVVEDGQRTVAVLDSLCRPPADDLPYVYERGPDKRIHVRDGDREVGVYGGIRAMRADAYHPVPAPLVPAETFAADPTDRWGVFVPGTEVVRTAAGRRRLP